MTSFDAILFDAGGIFLLPDPTVICPLLVTYGGSDNVEDYIRAHYRGMYVKSHVGADEGTWHDYNLAYVDAVGVPSEDRDHAATVLDHTRSAHLWRWPIPESVATLAKLVADGVPVGVVSNASGQIEDVLYRCGVCQVGDGPNTPVRVIIDSHIVGIAKPHAEIFEFALPHFAGIDRQRIAYVGDSVMMDIGGARNAGLHPILLDPYDDHPGADFERIRTLSELLAY